MTNQELNDLLARFEGSSLSKLKLSTQEFTIEMERAVSAPAAPVIPAAAAAPAAPVSAEPEGDAITAPMVGTFYAAPSPDEPAFVKVGDEVAANQTLCIVEAMKLMNEITAEEMGTVREVCVEDATPVEFGTVLFYIEPHTKTPLVSEQS